MVPEAGQAAAFCLLGVDRELLVGASARMRHMIRAAADASVRTTCPRCRTPGACGPECWGAGTTAAATRDSARPPRIRLVRQSSAAGRGGHCRPLRSARRSYRSPSPAAARRMNPRCGPYRCRRPLRPARATVRARAAAPAAHRGVLPSRSAGIGIQSGERTNPV